MSEQNKSYMKLAVAVMLRAIEDYDASIRFSRSVKAQHDGYDVVSWMESSSNNPWSFVWCCDLIGVDAGRMRAGILARVALTNNAKPLFSSNFNAARKIDKSADVYA